MVSRLAVLTLGAALLAAAADFWTKPFAQWTDKEIQQMATDSPWADRMLVETGDRGNIGNPDDPKGAVQGNLTAPIIVAWQTALPVKQALYGKVDNPQAKQLLERQETQHILRLNGFPGQFRANAQDLTKLTADTVIKIKGKPDLHPSEIQLSAPAGPGRAAPVAASPAEEAPAAATGRGARNAPVATPAGPGFGRGRGGGAPFDIYMVFPMDSITAADNEFEFQTKVGKMSIRKKYKVKDMMYNGKFEL